MSDDILERPPPKADAHIAYGAQPSQFGELFLPKGSGPHPVVIAIHGGFWRVQYDLHHLGHLCAALAHAGYAVWSLEYRRLGEAGGGWPGTFEDVATGAAHLQQIAMAHNLDMNHTISLGHSAGGHLALWLAARHKLAPTNPFNAIPKLTLRGVVPLAAVSDLVLGARLGLSGSVVEALLGGAPDVVPDSYALASPSALLPLGVGQHIVHGVRDDIVPYQMSRLYSEAARKAGDAAVLDTIDNAGHFELIDPESSAWPTVAAAVRALI
jgi:acetyl esterase/lipase